MSQELSTLDCVLTTLEGEIPVRVPSLCMGMDYEFIYNFMNSPYALTEQDLTLFEKDNLYFGVPNNQYLFAKFSPTKILPSGLDAKIDLCLHITYPGNSKKLEKQDVFVIPDGGLNNFTVKKNGIPVNWYKGPSLINKDKIQEYWNREKDLKPQKMAFQNFSRNRKTMLKKYDIVIMDGLEGPFENCTMGIGLANFAKFVRKEPQFLRKHMEFQWQVIEEPSLRLLMKTKPYIVMIGDDYGYNLGLQIPLKQWQEFIKPILKRFVDIVHEGGAKFVLHSCGDIHEIFPDLEEMGVDGVESLQPQINDLEMYRKKYPKITLLGAINDTEMLKNQSPEFIRNHVKLEIEKLGKKGGYIPGPTNMLLDQPVENVIALFKAIHEFGKY